MLIEDEFSSIYLLSRPLRHNISYISPSYVWIIILCHSNVCFLVYRMYLQKLHRFLPMFIECILTRLIIKISVIIVKQIIINDNSAIYIFYALFT